MGNKAEKGEREAHLLSDVLRELRFPHPQSYKGKERKDSGGRCSHRMRSTINSIRSDDF